MTRNTLGDMHNLLMEQMERLAQADGDGELKEEIKRAEAMTEVAMQVTANASNIIKAATISARMGGSGSSLPAMLGAGEER